MNIYDCFMYFDEDLLLDIRLNSLHKFVKKFVITEATYTHNGTKKKLNFDINKFGKFKDKITYIVVDKQPENIANLSANDSKEKKGEKLILNGMARDYFQRENLTRGLNNIHDDDLVLISDLDEIPNLKELNVSKIGNNIVIFEQKMFYYKLNLFYKDYTWLGTKAVKRKKFLSPQWLRNIKGKKYSTWRIDTLFSKKKYSNLYFVKNGGWHFNNLMSPEDISLKLKTFAHSEFANKKFSSVDVIKEKIKNKTDLFNRGHKYQKIKIDKNFPNYILDNLNKFDEYIVKN